MPILASAACGAVSLAGAAASDTGARAFVCLIKLIGNGYDRLDVLPDAAGQSGTQLRLDSPAL